MICASRPSAHAASTGPTPISWSSIARTGVTVLDPGGDCLADPVPAGVAVLNGAGELTGRSQIEEWGFTETPVFLTSTMQVGRVYDAACQLLAGGASTFGRRVSDAAETFAKQLVGAWLKDN